jgi:outer membrane protein, heavy metal efflux system
MIKSYMASSDPFSAPVSSERAMIGARLPIAARVWRIATLDGEIRTIRALSAAIIILTVTLLQGQACGILRHFAAICGSWYTPCVTVRLPYEVSTQMTHFSQPNDAGRKPHACRQQSPVFRSRTRRILLALLLPAMVLATLLRNAAASEVTLDHAVSLAIASNPDFAATEQELNIAAGEQIRSRYLSQFNPQTGTDFAYRPRGGRSNSQDWHVILSQEIEVFGQRALRMKSANLGWRQSAAMVRDRLRLLSTAVKLTFLEALRTRQQTQLLGELEKLDSRLHEAARMRLKAGEIGQIDYNLAAVRYGETSRALVEARERYRAQRSTLGRLLGGTAGPEPEPADDYNLKLPASDLRTLIDMAVRNRPDLRASELEIARLETQATLNKRLALPNPQIGAFFGHEENTQHPSGITFGFSVPLFNRRQAEGAIIEAQRRQAN